MPLPNPVIVVPGITATNLRDEYPIPPKSVWTVLSKHFQRITPHPDDLRYEVKEPARVVSDQVIEIVYEELVEELRFNLRQKEGEPIPVFTFGYDWRQPLEYTEEQLAQFITEVTERTGLLKHYARRHYAKQAKVNLIGHSMGGLIVAGYLERYRKRAPVDKVVTLAAPFGGSFEAVIKIITGTANLGTKTPSSREREAARLTPALYYLIPSIKKGMQPENLPKDALFDPDNWQSNIIDSMATFIRSRGLPGGPPKERAVTLFKDLLKKGQNHQKRLRRFHLNDAGLGDNDWLAVVGVDTMTRVRLRLNKTKRGTRFILQSTDRDNQWHSLEEEKRRLTGDGTVPYEAAIPPFIPEDRLVCVTPDDYGYWELQDKTVTKLAGLHGILPNMNMLHRLIVRFFTRSSDKYNATWGHRAPAVKKWRPPLTLREKK